MEAKGAVAACQNPLEDPSLPDQVAEAVEADEDVAVIEDSLRSHPQT